MPLPTIRETDLLLSQKALDDLRKSRENRGLAQPIEDVIAAAASLVGDYTAAYDLPGDRWLRLVRPIAVYNLMSFPGSSVPDAVKADWAAAIKELEAIRDGKFAATLAANPSTTAPAPAPGGSFGGKPRLSGT